MDAANLATIFGHSIWRNKSEDMEESLQQVQRASQLFHLMLENYSFFFEVCFPVSISSVAVTHHLMR